MVVVAMGWVSFLVWGLILGWVLIVGEEREREMVRKRERDNEEKREIAIGEERWWRRERKRVKWIKNWIVLGVMWKIINEIRWFIKWCFKVDKIILLVLK